MKSRRKYIYLFLLLFSTLYSNTIYFPKAKLNYNFYDKVKNVESNDLKINTRGSTPTIRFFSFNQSGDKFVTSFCEYKDYNSFKSLDLPKVSGNYIQLDNIRVKQTDVILNSDTVFVEVNDKESDIDKSKKDEILLTLQNRDDIEVIKLHESSKNSGIFRGYFQPTKSEKKNFDGKIYIQQNQSLEVSIDKLKVDLPLSGVLRSLQSYTTKDIWLQNASNLDEISSGEVLKNEIIVRNNSQNSVSSNFYIKLDNYMKFIEGSLRVDENKTISYGSLKERNFLLTIPANSQKIISYKSHIGLVKDKKLLRQKIQFMGNLLEIDTNVIDDFMSNNSFIVGKVGFGTKGIKGVKLYLENGISTITDKNGRYHFEGIEPSFHVVKIDPTTIGSRFEITSCEQNIKFAGSKTTQFVDTSTSHIARADFCVKYVGKKNNKKSFKKNKPIKSKKMPKYSKESFSKKENKILWPPDNFIPPFPSIKLAFMHKSNFKYKVYINNKEVDKLAYDGFEVSKDKSYKIEKYRGVMLSDGDNRLKIELLKDGKVEKVLQKNIHFSSSPVRAEIVKNLSRLNVDATTSAILAVRFFDKDGYPVREGMVGKCSINSPYYFYQDSKSESAFFIRENKKYFVENDGIAYLKLKPTSISGEIKLRFDFMKSDEYLSSWLSVEQNHWIIVGFAKGSVGYKTIKKKMQNISEQKDFKSIKGSFFAKGKVSGDTILTIAYNSSKKVDLTKLANSNLKKSYLVFVDKSKQQNEAPSSKKLYIKLERKNFYTLFGDFKTGLDKTKLATYSVLTNGIKSKLKTKGITYTAFATNSKNIHMKDELTPDGTSGKYYLKNKNIIENSETIKIVTRDKDDYNKVLKSEILSRDIDYNIDYHEGSIYFKDFQFSSDKDFNKRYIVVDYEITPDKNELQNLTFGAHVALTPSKNLKLGTTYVKSKRGLDESELKGIDVMLRLYKNIDIKLEGAKSKENKTEAKANFAKVKYHKKDITIELSHQMKEKDFGIQNQENMRDLDSKIDSIKSSYDITKRDKLVFKKDRKKTISTKIVEKKESIEYLHKSDSYSFSTGFRKITQDSISDKKALFSLRNKFLNSRLITSITKVKSLNKSLLEPEETIFNVDYMLKPSIKLFAQSRVAKLKEEKTKTYKAGVNTNPWSGANANVAFSSQEEVGEEKNSFLNYGLTQNIKADKNLDFLLGYDSQQSIKGKNSIDDYKTYSGLVRYTKDKLNYRLKSSFKDSVSDKLENSLSIDSKLNNNYAVALGLRSSKVFGKEKSSEISTRAVVAYRPYKKRTIILNQTDIKVQKDKESNSKKLINNTYFDTEISKKSTLDAQLGLKYVSTKIDDENYRDLIGLIGLNINYDFTKKISINSQVSMSFSIENKTYELSAGSSLGYSPFRDSVICFGYNVEGFNDEDFESDTYRAKGAYMNFLLKFDEFSLSERAKRSVK